MATQIPRVYAQHLLLEGGRRHTATPPAVSGIETSRTHTQHHTPSCFSPPARPSVAVVSFSCHAVGPPGAATGLRKAAGDAGGLLVCYCCGFILQVHERPPKEVSLLDLDDGELRSFSCSHVSPVGFQSDAVDRELVGVPPQRHAACSITLNNNKPPHQLKT